MTKSIVLFFALAFLVVSSCKSSKDVQTPESISLQRTGCFGTCPIYTFSLLSNGEGRFEGKRFTEKLGHWEKQFDLSEVESIMEMFRVSELDSFQDDYPTQITDLPANILRVQFKEKSKEIYIGGEHPAELESLVDVLIELAESPDWENMNKS